MQLPQCACGKVKVQLSVMILSAFGFLERDVQRIMIRNGRSCVKKKERKKRKSTDLEAELCLEIIELLPTRRQNKVVKLLQSFSAVSVHDLNIIRMKRKKRLQLVQEDADKVIFLVKELLSERSKVDSVSCLPEEH